jgi:carbamoyltransferase
MVILGLGGLLGDAACAVLKDGELKAAIEENKLDHVWRPGGLPQASIAECLRLAGTTRDEVECVAVVRPFARPPESQMHSILRDQFPKAEIAMVEHHQAHAASAFFASPFEEATVLTLDHDGDFRCGTRWHARDTQIQAEREWYYPDSLGRLYGAVTQLLGYRAGAEEHKVQWLSAAGDERYAPLFREVVTASARLDPSFFDGHRQSEGGFSPKFFQRLGFEEGVRIPAATVPAIARGLQKTVEETVLGLAGEGENLCLAGGLFLNVMLVEFLERCGRWKNVFVQPAAGNAGTALGAVYHVWHQVRRNPRRGGMQSLFLGPGYVAEEIKQVLENCKLRFRYLRSTDDMLGHAVRMLGEHKILAWMQGRMEFGPRALGNRSIVARPTEGSINQSLNERLSRTEFMPFAPSVLAEHAEGVFENVAKSARCLPFMTITCQVRPEWKARIPAVVHVDGTARPQTVARDVNPLYWSLIDAYRTLSGIPLVLNTSFNVHEEPIVCFPANAVQALIAGRIDCLALGPWWVEGR